MVYKVVPTESFKREYHDIVNYLVEHLDAPRSARLLVNAMGKMRGILADNPRAYAVSCKPMLEELEFREYLIRSYVAVYRIENEFVYLEHMFHQKKNFEKACKS